MITFEVHPDNAEPFEVTATSRDIYQWEKRGKGRVFSKMADALAMTDLYEIAHQASVRTGKFAGTLTAFEDTIDLHFDEDEAAADPTPPAR